MRLWCASGPPRGNRETEQAGDGLGDREIPRGSVPSWRATIRLSGPKEEKLLDWSSLLALPPSSESGVYYCLGLAHEAVWQGAGKRLRFEKFEAKPGDHPESGGKHLDGIAELVDLHDGSIARVGIEFKRLSSDLLSDLIKPKFAGFQPEVLVVWRHDAQGVALLSPRTLIVEVGPAMTEDEEQLRFCSATELGTRCVSRVEGQGAKDVVKAIVASGSMGLWPKWLAANSSRGDGAELGEVRLTYGSHRRVVGRLNQYQTPGLNLFLAPDSPCAVQLALHGGMRRNTQSVSIRLDRYDPSKVSHLVEALHIAATDDEQSTAR